MIGSGRCRGRKRSRRPKRTVEADLHSLEDAQDQLKVIQSVSDPRAISQDDLDRRSHAVDIAKAHLSESQANLALLRAGSWDQDLKVAQADIESTGRICRMRGCRCRAI